MDEIQIIATLYRSAGNETVGYMWSETAIFNITDEIVDIIKWACKVNGTEQLEHFNKRLEITIGQTPRT